MSESLPAALGRLVARGLAAAPPELVAALPEASDTSLARAYGLPVAYVVALRALDEARRRLGATQAEREALLAGPLPHAVVARRLGLSRQAVAQLRSVRHPGAPPPPLGRPRGAYTREELRRRYPGIEARLAELPVAEVAAHYDVSVSTIRRLAAALRVAHG